MFTFLSSKSEQISHTSSAILTYSDKIELLTNDEIMSSDDIPSQITIAYRSIDEVFCYISLNIYIFDF